ncbi:MAG: virulence RhuM family protein [Bacteroidetes bacterium]|nr:virulence RhuM family protein [Bacteroidota bacterium]MBU1717801.1 virulence RhuM family protein [Bacteroidota bacterium]
MDNKGEIVIYQTPDGSTVLEVSLSENNIWLSQKQMANLFDKDYKTISKHIQNIFKEGELDKSSTVANFATVQVEGGRSISREIEYYNLDAIISVGYRVHSKRGTQFRIWANQVLKDYLVKGYALDQKRLAEQSKKIEELYQTIDLIKSLTTSKELSEPESQGLLRVITDYVYALNILDQYDHQKLQVEATSKGKTVELSYRQAQKIVAEMRNYFVRIGEDPGLFGNEKDKSFKSSIENIYQTFDKNDLYPSTEEKAAHLLYFLIKNHSFVDGNKRIGAFIFISFLNMNGMLYTETGQKRIADNALVALCLMIAESKPEEKDIMIKVVVNLINHRNG